MNSSALKNRNYLIYIGGTVISLHGVWIYRVALGWLAWELSHSEFWVGLVAFTQFAPTVILSPIFGVLADRYDRRVTAILISALSFINMLILSLLEFRGSTDIYLLVLLSLMQGTLDGAYAPVRLALVPNLVPPAQRHSAIAFTSVAFNLSRFVGPALAGMIIAFWSVGAAFLVNSVTYLAVVIAMFLVRLRSSGSAAAARKHPWLELLEGARYVMAHATIRSLLLLSLLRCLLGRGSLEMLPVFADDVFQGGARALSILTSAAGAGAVVAGIALSFGTRWLTMTVIRADIMLAGLLIVGLAISERLAVAMPVVAVIGALQAFGGVGSQMLIQSLVDEHVRGRVSSFWGAVVFGGTSLGALIIGAAAHAWGLRWSVSVAGLLCALIIAAGWAGRLASQVRHRSGGL